MRQNLLETYGRQIKVAEAYVAKNYGKEISANTQLTTAVLLDNTNRFMTAMNESVATTHSDLGEWKKFCLNLTNIAVPSLIANDLVIVHPMTSYSGSVAYLKYTAATNKGGVSVGDEFNSAFGLGQMSDGRVDYTSERVTEAATAGTGAQSLAWTTNGDIKHGVFPVKVGQDIVKYDIKLVKAETADIYGFYKAADKKFYSDAACTTQITVAADTKVAYVYDAEVIPQNDIPSIKAELVQIALVAQPRRIAVKYNQIAAFQAKTDYGFSLDKQIAEQACGELAYEIDTEIVDMLAAGAKANPQGSITWNKTLPIGVSKFEHYNGFLEVIEEAKARIYKATGKFHPNFMVIGAKVLTVLRFVNGFTAVKSPKMNGPYKVGEIDGLGVYVSPRLGDNEFFFGLNGSDMMSSCGVYAPYMAIVPTQLLGFADGTMSQGFSTYYAKALLNEKLLVAGEITETL